jgi:hypothetical protein
MEPSCVSGVVKSGLSKALFLKMYVERKPERPIAALRSTQPLPLSLTQSTYTLRKSSN